MKKREIIIICLILCFICSLQAVVAAEVSTENTNKNVTSTSPAEVAVVANNDLIKM